MFSRKGQRVNSLSLVGHAVSVITVYPCHRQATAATATHTRTSVGVFQ